MYFYQILNPWDITKLKASQELIQEFMQEVVNSTLISDNAFRRTAWVTPSLSSNNA